MRDLYGEFLRTFHVMPDVLARQVPKILFKTLNSFGKHEDEVKPYDGSDPQLRMFYGL